MADVRERAIRWLDPQIISHPGCIERLAAIQNDAVNLEAQAAVLERMRDELEVWTYLRALIPEKASGNEGGGEP